MKKIRKESHHQKSNHHIKSRNGSQINFAGKILIYEDWYQCQQSGQTAWRSSLWISWNESFIAVITLRTVVTVKIAWLLSGLSKYQRHRYF